MTGRTTPAGRRREQRELFQRALREGVSMDEARRRTAAERWAHIDSLLAARKAPCADDARAPGFWWQRD